MTFDLPDEVVSLQQVQLLKLETDNLIGAINEASRRQQSASVEVPPAIRAMLGNNQPTPASLEELSAWLAKAALFPVVHLALPALPGKQLRQQLASWFRTNISADVLLAFEPNAGLAGGFGLRVGGAVFDFSFRRRLIESYPIMTKLMNDQRYAAAAPETGDV